MQEVFSLNEAPTVCTGWKFIRASKPERAAWCELAGRARHAVLVSSEPNQAEGLISVQVMSGMHVLEFHFSDEVFVVVVQDEEAFAWMCCILL